MKLIVMAGLPCSGKSTLVNEINKNLNYEILSYDDVRETFSKERGILYTDSFDPKFSKVITKLYHLRRESLIKEKKNIILDATNINSGVRSAVLLQFPGYNPSCIFVVTPIDVCISRNMIRKWKFIPESVFWDFEKKKELVSETEEFSEFHIVPGA